jgi:hypothetical protein
MLPFIQCHQTRGFALSGGFLNPASSFAPESPERPEQFMRTIHGIANNIKSPSVTKIFLLPIKAFIVKELGLG